MCVRAMYVFLQSRFEMAQWYVSCVRWCLCVSCVSCVCCVLCCVLCVVRIYVDVCMCICVCVCLWGWEDVFVHMCDVHADDHDVQMCAYR